MISSVWLVLSDFNHYSLIHLKEGNYYVQFENLCDEHPDCIDGSDETEGTYWFLISIL